MLPNKILVNHVTTGENILISTHVESVTQFKLLNNSHSVKFKFLLCSIWGGK